MSRGTRDHLVNLIANMWIERVPEDEAGRILGYDLTSWKRIDILQALYDGKMDMLDCCEDEQLPELLRLEQNYIKYRSRH